MRTYAKTLLLGAALALSGGAASAVSTTIVPFNVQITSNYDVTSGSFLSSSSLLGVTGSGYYDWTAGSTPGDGQFSLSVDFASGTETFQPSDSEGTDVQVNAQNDLAAVKMTVLDDKSSTPTFDDIIAATGVSGFFVTGLVPEVGSTPAILQLQVNTTSPAAVPLPATAGLSLAALALMGGFAARRRRKVA